MKSKHSIPLFLVDDNPVCLHAYELALKKLGYQNIHSFQSSNSFLENLVRHPKIIFLDYYIDDKNGLEILKKIKQFDPHITVVFISGQDDVLVAVNALKAGAFEYMEKKNFSAEKLQPVMQKLERLHEYLAKRSKKRRLTGIFSSPTTSKMAGH
jgi:DNA-binding NtrC family response regulator